MHSSEHRHHPQFRRLLKGGESDINMAEFALIIFTSSSAAAASIMGYIVVVVVLGQRQGNIESDGEEE